MSADGDIENLLEGGLRGIGLSAGSSTRNSDTLKEGSFVYRRSERVGIFSKGKKKVFFLMFLCTSTCTLYIKEGGKEKKIIRKSKKKKFEELQNAFLSADKALSGSLSVDVFFCPLSLLSVTKWWEGNLKGIRFAGFPWLVFSQSQF